MTVIDDKLNQMVKIIEEIRSEDEAIGNILMEGFGISLNIIKLAIENGGRERIDISEYLEAVSAVLGVSLSDMVGQLITNNTVDDSTKVADEETLNFITSDMDDYEKFLAKNKVKEDIEFLSGNI